MESTKTLMRIRMGAIRIALFLWFRIFLISGIVFLLLFLVHKPILGMDAGLSEGIMDILWLIETSILLSMPIFLLLGFFLNYFHLKYLDEKILSLEDHLMVMDSSMEIVDCSTSRLKKMSKKRDAIIQKLHELRETEQYLTL